MEWETVQQEGLNQVLALDASMHYRIGKACLGERMSGFITPNHSGWTGNSGLQLRTFGNTLWRSRGSEKCMCFLSGWLNQHEYRVFLVPATYSV